MTGVIATIPKYQFSSNGIPMVGGTLTTYVTGTSTPSTTWADFAQTTANTNPITLDSRGECVLFLDGSVSYRFVLKNSSGVTQWTQDNVGGAGGSVTYMTGVSGTNSITASLAGVSSYTAGLMVTFTAAGSNTGAVTLNINSLGVANLVRSDGVALVANDIVSGGTYEAIYDGTSFKLQGSVAVSQIATTPFSFKNLALSTTGLSATVSVTADEVVLANSTNGYMVARSVSLSIAGTTSGAANGLDTGTIAASTWYSIWVISNGTTTAGLMSLSATAPTMPSGYTFKARIGWIRTDATGNKYPFAVKQFGRRVSYTVSASSNITKTPRISTGAVGTPFTVYAAVSVSAVVPTTASIFFGELGDPNGSSLVAVAPNNNFGSATTNTNPPPVWQVPAATGFSHESFSMMLESANIYASMSNGYINCSGWEDNL